MLKVEFHGVFLASSLSTRYLNILLTLDHFVMLIGWYLEKAAWVNNFSFIKWNSTFNFGKHVCRHHYDVRM